MRSDALRTGLDMWMKQDLNAAVAWAEKYTGPGQTAVQAILVEAKAQIDPRAAMIEYGKVQHTATDQSELRGAASVIANKLAAEDTASALTWAVSLAPGASRDEAMSIVTAKWVRDDSVTASQWIANLPAGRERDRAADSLADAIKKRDPNSAFEWARNIQNEGLRIRVMEEVIREWRQQDPDAAEAALRVLPPQLRKNFVPQEE